MENKKSKNYQKSEEKKYYDEVYNFLKERQKEINKTIDQKYVYLIKFFIGDLDSYNYDTVAIFDCKDKVRKFLIDWAIEDSKKPVWDDEKGECVYYHSNINDVNEKETFNNVIKYRDWLKTKEKDENIYVIEKWLVNGIKNYEYKDIIYEDFKIKDENE